jgi:ribulose-5-phosphate 4-epimerase/fuculose-1-phosphate aldolase
VTGGQKQFLINPFGLHYSEVTASNLLKIDIQGNKLDDNPWPVNPAGFTIHAAIHDNVDGAHCVMHTHTTNGLAVACTQGGLAQNNFYSASCTTWWRTTTLKASPCMPKKRHACWPAWATSRC